MTNIKKAIANKIFPKFIFLLYYSIRSEKQLIKNNIVRKYNSLKM